MIMIILWDCAMAQAGSYWPLIVYARVFSKYLGFPVSVIPPMLHIQSLIYHQHYITSAIDSVIK